MYNKLKQFIKNYSIHNKLKRTLGCILGLAIFLMIVVIPVVLFIFSITNSLYSGPYKVSQTISDIRVNLQTMNMNMYRSIIETNLDDRNIYLQLANEESAKLTFNLEILKDIFKIKSCTILAYPIFVLGYAKNDTTFNARNLQTFSLVIQ